MLHYVYPLLHYITNPDIALGMKGELHALTSQVVEQLLALFLSGQRLPSISLVVHEHIATLNGQRRPSDPKPPALCHLVREPPSSAQHQKTD